MKLDSVRLIEAYNNNKSLNTIAKEFHTYATSVKRVLEREGVELRHDAKNAGDYYVQDGEKLIEWAKAQGRLVSKTELAAVLGRKRLSSSYFMKYPELNKYILVHEQKDLHEYNKKLFDYLQENNIPYKPSDKKKLGVAVSALLLEEYSNLAIQVDIKPKCMSKKYYKNKINTIQEKAKDLQITVILVDESYFENLSVLKSQLDKMKIGG